MKAGNWGTESGDRNRRDHPLPAIPGSATGTSKAARQTDRQGVVHDRGVGSCLVGSQYDNEVPRDSVSTCCSVKFHLLLLLLLLILQLSLHYFELCPLTPSLTTSACHQVWGSFKKGPGGNLVIS